MVQDGYNKVAIFAGNSRVSLSDDGLTVVVEPQLQAFRAALARAAELRRVSGELPLISVAFDHKGVFRKQFLAEGLTNSQKKHPRLAQLRQEIVSVFAPAAAEFGIALGDIAAIHEDSARTHASYVLQLNNLPADIIRVMKVQDADPDDDAPEMPQISCATGTHPTSRVTCAAVTSEYFARSTVPDSEVLEVFIENDPWSQINVYTRGAALAERMGATAAVRMRLVAKDGRVFGGNR